MDNKPRTIIISGKQAAGKETQVSSLEEKLGGNTIVYESGQTLRNFSKRTDNVLSPKIKDLLEGGTFIPTWLTMNLFFDKFIELKGDENLILDGLPRDMKQAKILEEAFNLSGRDSIDFIHLDISDNEAIRRISLRYYCENCGKVYSVNELNGENKCAKCEGKLSRRDDDTAESLNERLKWSNQKLNDVYEFYKVKGKYHHIDGEQEISAVTADIVKVLGL